MTLYLIGLGLYDAKDITLRGLEAVKLCDEVYLEHYTSILSHDVTELEALYGREVHIANRDFVEKEADEKLIEAAKTKNVALLIVGDVFGATTHTDLMVRAKQSGVKVEIIYNASILNAIGVVGLELYKYGKTTSIVFADDNWLPHTPYEVIKNNQSLGLHTLCLLDIKVAEPSKEDLLRQARGEEVKPAPPRYMTVQEGIDVLERIEQEQGEGIITPETKVIGVARIGHPDFTIFYGMLEDVKAHDFGGPLHCLIVPGTLQVVEKEALE